MKMTEYPKNENNHIFGIEHLGVKNMNESFCKMKCNAFEIDEVLSVSFSFSFSF